MEEENPVEVSETPEPGTGEAIEGAENTDEQKVDDVKAGEEKANKEIAIEEKPNEEKEHDYKTGEDKSEEKTNEEGVAHVEAIDKGIEKGKSEHGEGEHVEGEHVERELVEGKHVEEEHIEGEHVEGDNVEDEHIEGKHVEGKQVKREHVEGEHVEGELVEGEYIEGEHIEDEHVKKEHVEGEYVEGEYVEGEHVEREHVEGEHVEGEHVEGEHVEGEHIEGEHVEGEELMGEEIEGEKTEDQEKNEEPPQVTIEEKVEEEEVYIEEPPPDPAAPFDFSESQEALKEPFELRPDQLAEVEQLWEFYQNYTPVYTDIDNYITEKELVYMLKSLMLMTYTPEQLQELIVYCVRPPHPEGHISYEQFLKMVILRQREFPTEDELRSALQVFDPGRTGSIDREHLKEVLSKEGHQMPQKQLNNLIKEVDISNDGTIGVEDVVGTMCIDLNKEDLIMLRNFVYPPTEPPREDTF